MAPEQVRGESADPCTDIWALGVLMHEMLTGSRPFEAPTTPELFSAILRDPPRPITNEVPAGLQMIVWRCLEKAPARRYSNASEVRAALDVEHQTRATAPGSASLRRLAHRRWRVAAASLLVAAAVLAGFNVGGMRDRLGGIPSLPGR